MNFVYLFIEILFTFFLLVLFYRCGKKDGLYLYIGLMSSILSVVMFKVIDLFSFQINLGISIIMGLFICNNIIIQRFGMDEVKRINRTFCVSYLVTYSVIFLLTFMNNGSYNLIGNDGFDALFGVGNLRIVIAGFISVLFLLWYNSYIYYYIRRNRNNLWFSNIGSMLVIQMLESIIFILISYVGSFDFTLLFGMIVIRYLMKVFIGMMGLVPVYMIVKMRNE